MSYRNVKVETLRGFAEAFEHALDLSKQYKKKPRFFSGFGVDSSDNYREISESQAALLFGNHYPDAEVIFSGPVGSWPCEIIVQELTVPPGDECDECAAFVPAVDGGSIANKHHAESCSLYDAEED